jgi:hypothetical protein
VSPAVLRVFICKLSVSLQWVFIVLTLRDFLA